MRCSCCCVRSIVAAAPLVTAALPLCRGGHRLQQMTAQLPVEVGVSMRQMLVTVQVQMTGSASWLAG